MENKKQQDIKPPLHIVEEYSHIDRKTFDKLLARAEYRRLYGKEKRFIDEDEARDYLEER